VIPTRWQIAEIEEIQSEGIQAFSERFYKIVRPLQQLHGKWPDLLEKDFFANMLPEWGPEWVANDPQSVQDIIKMAHNAGIGERNEEASVARSSSPHPRKQQQQKRVCKFF